MTQNASYIVKKATWSFRGQHSILSFSIIQILYFLIIQIINLEIFKF